MRVTLNAKDDSMPGISFVCNLKGGMVSDSPHIAESLRSLLYDARYVKHDWLIDDFSYLGYTAYPEYPMERVDFGDITVFLEGQFYPCDSGRSKKALRELTERAFPSIDDHPDRLLPWITMADGDYIVLLYHNGTREIVIVNDFFGRLPVYCYRTPSQFMFSRDLRFISRLAGLTRFDRMALAQHLLVGYPLGKRTLLEGVHRLSPASCISINPGSSEVHIHRLHRFNCEPKASTQASVRDNAHELVDLFSRACTARAAARRANSVISLSGGFDSRSIAAGFHKCGLPFRAATFLDPNGRAETDVPIAQQIAELFGAEWSLFPLNPPQARDTLKLLRMKTGMNPLYLAFLLDFFEGVRTRFGSNLMFFSGEIGDRLLPDRRPRRNPRSLEDAVDSLLNEEPKFSVETVSALTQLKPTEIIGELNRHIESYPEQDWAQKCVHFSTFERIFKWLCEGEDRNRNYFWNATPYSGIEFFNFASHCPDEQKSYYALYREFLTELSPAATAVPHAGTGAPVTSNEFKTIRKAMRFLQERPDIRGRLEPLRVDSRWHDHDPVTLAYLKRQLQGSDAIFEYLSAPALKWVTDNASRYTKEAIDLLFTLTATIEDLLTGKSVLETRA